MISRTTQIKIGEFGEGSQTPVLEEHSKKVEEYAADSPDRTKLQMAAIVQCLKDSFKETLDAQTEAISKLVVATETLQLQHKKFGEEHQQQNQQQKQQQQQRSTMGQGKIPQKKTTKRIEQEPSQQPQQRQQPQQQLQQQPQQQQQQQPQPGQEWEVVKKKGRRRKDTGGEIRL
ncbi:RNA polymerase II degradation factor 1-like [Sipha flava]|uniref:RNA polymerase II degradation factor 1-like n=2 Tax=Sipha flava TaxID=143950 RepID=A0A8B8F9N3_9HEMI|nr:RNA polymerase II degradation factor 1-like [Sipha flava]